MSRHLVTEFEVSLRCDEDENLVNFEWVRLQIAGGEANVDLILTTVDCFNIGECEVVEETFARIDFYRLSFK